MKQTRREALGRLGAASVTLLVGCGGEQTARSGGAGRGAGVCGTKQETTVGPYPNVDPLERRDIRANTSGPLSPLPKEGALLTLRIRVLDVDAACAPIPGAVVDVWHCDAAGVYAGYAAFNTTQQDFCRGYQQTDEQGMAEFFTIFPGSYSGRAIHIHFSIQGAETNLRPNDDGGALPGAFVAQLYFERATADAVFADSAIYREGAAITPNASDGIYAGTGGAALVLRVSKLGEGYLGEVDVGVKRRDIGK